MKVGKEEIVGVLAAVEWSSKRDYQPHSRVWESRLSYIAKTLNAIPGVQARIYYRKIGNEVPHLAVLWDEKAFGVTKEQCVEALRNG
jgi:L-seryl-tRNA(Ser) seleniumtransferase